MVAKSERFLTDAQEKEELSGQSGVLVDIDKSREMGWLREAFCVDFCPCL
jgi:hypothetical protein